MVPRKIYPVLAVVIVAILLMPLTLSHPTAAADVPLGDPHTLAAAGVVSDPASPDASKITVHPPDVNGYAQISGAAGAVPGGVHVAIINTSTRNVSKAAASASGSFQATIFAPPGSFLLVKYTPRKELIDVLWNHALNPGGDFAYMNPLPGATIYVPGTDPGQLGMPYHTAGYLGAGEGPDWAGWWISGNLAGPGGSGDLHLGSGDSLTLNGTLKVNSPGMNCSNPGFSLRLHLQLRDLFGENGKARNGRTWFNSFIFTPTGMPIEHEGPSESRHLVTITINNFSCLNSNTVQASFVDSMVVPAGLDPGIYKLEGFIENQGVPLASGIRRVVVWYHYDPFAFLPPVTLGEPDPPRIPWTLFSGYTTNGHRGVQAEEDAGQYMLVTRTIFPPHRVVLPMLDSRSQQPVAYRLEPGSNWLSSTDRRFPVPPEVTLQLPGGSLQAVVHKPDGSQEVIGPSPLKQSSVTTPSLPDGGLMHEGTGHIGDMYHLYTGDPDFGYSFDQYGSHTISLSGFVEDVYGNEYPIAGTYHVMVARLLDLDPAQLPTTPYEQGDFFAPGLHVFPPLPAEVEVRVVHMPNSNPDQAQIEIFSGAANQFGYFQPPPGEEFIFNSPGEFRVDISAEYVDPDGTHWAGYVTWGNVVEGSTAVIRAHGRRGMDYSSNTINDMPIWFRNQDLPAEKIGIENYYPYFSGDIHWGEELAPASRRGDSIHSILTLEDRTGTEKIYELMRAHYPRTKNFFRQPPVDTSLAGLEKRLAIDEAPLFITTTSGRDPTTYPDEIDMWGYWYGSSERPDVHVREIISEDGMGTAYWRFNDTYGYQIGEPANGDQPGDIKWEFGGVVFRVPGEEPPVNEYAIYSSLWVLLPEGCDAYGCTRVTAPFQGTTGAGINGGPILTLLGEQIDILFLPKGVRPGDILEMGDTVAFSGHVGPPLDSRVEVTITSPTGVVRDRTLRASKIGWVYDPSFDFIANEPGRWRVDVHVEHDQPYIGNGVKPTSHNTGTVLGTTGQYEFYVVEPGSPRLTILTPRPGYINPPADQVQPVVISGVAPPGTSKIHYTIHDKGIVMGQGTLTPYSGGLFRFAYDPEKLHQKFSMLSLTAHDGVRKGLADEVSIHLLAVGSSARAASITLIGEEIFVDSLDPGNYLPLLPRE